MTLRLALALSSVLLLSACGTPTAGSESTRAILLQYLGGDVGTVGPFGKGGKKELTVLSDAERAEAEALIDKGAMMFLIYGGSAGGQPGVSRVVLMQDKQVVRDYVVRPKA